MKHVFQLRAGVFAWAVCLLAQLAGLPAAFAVRVDTLYQATVPVADRTPASLDAAFDLALVQVLVKVTGDAQVATQPGLAAALKQPSQYIQEYAYQQPSPPATAAASPPTQPQALQLKVHFDPPAVNALLQAAHLPLWGRERPLVILWVGVDAGSAGRYLVGGDADQPHPGARQTLLQAAQARGIPVIFPLFDLKDQMSVHFSDLEGGFLDPIVNASTRYEANAVMVGVVRPSTGGQWQGSWSLVFRARTVHWTSQGADRNAVLTSGVAGVADRLAALFAVTGAPQPDQSVHALKIVISGVHHIGDYVRIDRRLTHLEPIASARLVKVEGDRLTYQVLPRGTVQDVSRNLALLSWLVPDPGAPPVAASQPAAVPSAESPPVVAQGSPPTAATVTAPPTVSMPEPMSVLYFRYQP